MFPCPLFSVHATVIYTVAKKVGSGCSALKRGAHTQAAVAVIHSGRDLPSCCVENLGTAFVLGVKLTTIGFLAIYQKLRKQFQDSSRNREPCLSETKTYKICETCNLSISSIVLVVKPHIFMFKLSCRQNFDFFSPMTYSDYLRCKLLQLTIKSMLL